MPELPRDLAYEDLILIDDLNVALESGTGEVAIEDWWAKVEKLETLLSGDSRHTKEDMQALQRLKDGITLATLAVREGMKPDTHLGPDCAIPDPASDRAPDQLARMAGP